MADQPAPAVTTPSLTSRGPTLHGGDEGENASREAREQGADREEEEEEGLVATFRKRRIAFKTLSRPLQALLLLALAQIGVVALLLATQNLPQPQVSSGVIGPEGQHFVVPLAAFIVLAVSLTAGTWFALAGALRVQWGVRFLVIALVTWSLAQSPLSSLTTNAGLRVEPFVTEVRVYWIQLALLALFWIWAAGVSLLRWRAQRKGAVLPPDSRPWHGWTFGMAVVPILLYYGLDLVIWRADVAAGLPNSGASLLLNGIGTQSLLLPPFLLLLVYWYSKDLLEWGEIIAKSIVTATQRVRVPQLLMTATTLAAMGMLVNVLRLEGKRVRMPWLLMMATTLAAVAMLVNVLRLEGKGIVLGLALLAVVIALVALVVRFARIRSDWPAQIPPLAFLLGAIVLYLQYAVTEEVIGPLAVAHGLVLGVLGSLYLLMAVPVLLIALTIALVLVVRGRLGKPKQGAVGLFLIMVVLLDVTGTLPGILSAADFRVALLQQPYRLFYDLQFFAAVGVLIWIIRLRVRRQPLTEASRPLVSAFLLLAGLQTIDWLSDLAHGITALGARSPLLLAGLFVLTALWDLVTSGEQVTNTDSPAFPREGRMLLYLGYTVVATSLLLYIGSLRAQTTGAPAPDYFAIDSYAPLGLFVLGSSMVVLTFLLSVGRRIRRTAVVAAPQPAGRVSPRTTQFGIVGSGALALALVMVFLVVSAWPRLVHTSQVLLGHETYTAASPGPGCDTGGALWNVFPDAPINLSCLPLGTRITALPKGYGWVGFFPPGNTQVQNYRVSVQVDFSSAPHACVGIFTHFSGIAKYDYEICARGPWWVLRQVSHTFTVFAKGQVARTRMYTLEATTDGPKQSLTINGIEKASVSDGTLTTGSIVLEVVNYDSSTQSVVLSDFSYTPLPKSTAIATPAFSLPPTAVLAFRDPLTNAGRWKNQPANAHGWVLAKSPLL